MLFRARQFEFRFPRPALVMGIVNVTPDSFSDGGNFFDANAAVKHALKSLIQFDFHNLKTEFLPQRNDIIFCRNVMIYFDEPEQKRLVEKFYRCLNPEGYLFVGHAESLFGLTKKFHMIHENNATVYQRIEETK